MTRQSAEIIAREMGGKVVKIGHTDRCSVMIETGYRDVVISDDKIEAFDGDKVQNRIWLKPPLRG